MKIIRQEEGYIKLELVNGQVLIIDETEQARLVDSSVKEEQTRIHLYNSTDKFDLYTPLAVIDIEGDKVELDKPKPWRREGKIMAFAPELLFNETANEFWSRMREEIKNK